MSAQIIKDPKTVKIKRALLSVSDKTGIEKLAKCLVAHGVELISTGGTRRMLEEQGLEVKDISDITQFPEMMDGRVKTLHPNVHGGLLARRDVAEHVAAMGAHGIQEIDMVVINLYPFAETVASGADFETCIENIDIGGPAMIRSAAKNHNFVSVITHAQDYDKIIKELDSSGGEISLSTRRRLALSAYSRTASYDSAISRWFAEQEGDHFPQMTSVTGHLQSVLRYGENPHQEAALYLDRSNRPGVATATIVQGKELSYNNLNDTDAAFELVAEFDKPAIAIIKHANPCGVAEGENALEAYKLALRCDPVSAFGGIVAVNRPISKELAEEIVKVFTEVVIAPSVEPGALDVFASKKNLRLLTTGEMPKPADFRRQIKTISGGFLLQDIDNGCVDKKDLKVVTDREPTSDEFTDMLFAFRVAKHVKSNAIVYVKDGATVGIGAGQMSRVDSCRIAAQKAADAEKAAGLEPGTLIRGSVVASDAFFPFADGLLTAAEAGASAVIQPGGSIRDEEVVEAANERSLAMVYTGMRHFRH